MNLHEFFYDDQVIEFDIAGEDVMINATEMGRIFGKRPVDFLKQEGTKAFIAELKTAITAFRSDGESLLNAENATLPEDFVVRSERGKGSDGGSTWMHKQLALKFASWLDPKFEVWIYQTIDRLLFEHVKRTSDELKEKAKLSDRRDDLIQKLQGLSDFQEYMQIEFKIRQANNRISKFNNNQLSIFRNG